MIAAGATVGDGLVAIADALALGALAAVGYAVVRGLFGGWR